MLSLIKRILLNFSMQHSHLSLMLQQKRKNQRQLLYLFSQFLNLKIFDSDPHIKSWIRKPSCYIILYSSMMGLAIMLEEVNTIVLSRKILKLIP